MVAKLSKQPGRRLKVLGSGDKEEHRDRRTTVDPNPREDHNIVVSLSTWIPL